MAAGGEGLGLSVAPADRRPSQELKWALLTVEHPVPWAAEQHSIGLHLVAAAGWQVIAAEVAAIIRQVNSK